MQPTKEQEQEWRSRFEVFGEATVRADLDLRGGVGIGISGPMVEVTRRWLSEKEQERGRRELAREHRERLTLTIAKWTLVAALAAVAIGIAGLIATMMVGR
jgi:hypothetical protein